MQCDQFEARWQLLLDLRQSPECDTVLREHAAACPQCQLLLLTQQQLFDGLEMAEIPASRPDFADRVVARIDAAPTRRWRTSAHIPLVLLALSGSLLLAALPIAWKMRQQPNTIQTTAHISPAIPPMVNRETPSQRHDQASGADWWVVPPETLRELYPLEARRRHREQVGRFAEDLRPITHCFTAAAHALRSTIPVGKNRPKSQRPQARAPAPAWLTSLT